MSETANADQIAYWNATAGETWAALNDALDRQLAPLGRRAIDLLAPATGERILDVGCGCGATTLELARRVGPDGSVTGIDISRPMLEVARGRAAETPQAAFLEADAQAHAFAPGEFDALFSRFGVMFFAEPAAAFANLRSALKPRGRLAFVCWRPLAENPWMTTPMAAGAPHLPPPQPPPPPGAPGPFAFADRDRLRRILADAGFTDIMIDPHDEPVGGQDLDGAVATALRVGPLGALLRETPQARPQVVEAVRAALADHLREGRVYLPSASWMVTARSR